LAGFFVFACFLPAVAMVGMVAESIAFAGFSAGRVSF
jgi:hypothetical protein